MADKELAVRLTLDGAGKVKADFKSAGAEAEKMFAQVNRGARSNTAGLQNVGFQVQDFAVQVASGTDATRAMAQQLPQLLSGFGLLGVALGTSAAVVPALFQAFGVGVDKSQQLTKSVDALAQAVQVYDAAAKAAAATPIDLFGDFGMQAGQAKEVLEIQRQIAAARAQNALAQASGAIAGIVDPQALAETLQRIQLIKAEMASAQADPNRVAMFNFDRARQQLEFETEYLKTIFDDMADQLGIALDGAETEIAQLAQKLLSLRDASGADAQAEALAGVRAAMIAVATATGGASEEVLVMLQSLTDAELAALGLAQVDLASNIGAGADEALRLADNLFDALAAQRQFDRGNKSYGGRGADPRQFMDGGAKPFVPSREVIEKADAMLNPRPARGGGGGGGAGQAEREAARIYDQTRTAAERYKVELSKLNELHKSGHLDTDTFNRAVKKLGEDLDKTGDMGQRAASAIRSAFDNLFDDPAEALKNLAKQLAQMALYQQLATSMPSIFGAGGIIPLMNANGNAFDRGVVQAFASGGVVSSATMFPMRGGMGVMGEAGPEAIMPLTKIGGKLGVAAAGGGGANVKLEVHNYGGGEVQTQERRGPNGERVIRMMVGKDLASGAHDASLRSRFGNRPNPIKR